MKSLCLTLAGLVFFAVAANAQAPFLRVTNKVGDYWVYRFNLSVVALNMTYDVDHISQKESDREIKLTDIDLAASITATFRPQGGNLSKIRLVCKTPGCVYSHFESNTYNEFDIFCVNPQDCVGFVQGVPLQ
jgi:hypothetical protein